MVVGGTGPSVLPPVPQPLDLHDELLRLVVEEGRPGGGRCWARRVEGRPAVPETGGLTWSVEIFTTDLLSLKLHSSMEFLDTYCRLPGSVPGCRSRCLRVWGPSRGELQVDLEWCWDTRWTRERSDFPSCLQQPPLTTTIANIFNSFLEV